MSRLQHKAGRKSNYAHALKDSPYWKEVKQKVLFRDRSCRNILPSNKVCESKLFLEVHHKTYYIDGKSIVGKELEYLHLLMLVCGECHAKIHGKSK